MSNVRKPCGLHCIKIHHLSVTLDQQKILEDINLHIHCGKWNVIIGQNGAGKSTFIKAILNEIPHEGKIVYQYKGNALSQRPLKIGYVPQSLNIDKHTPVSVYDFLAAYMSRRPIFLKKSRKLQDKIEECLSLLQVEDCMEKQLCNLSGGQMQRVLISLALLEDPQLLLLDEPVAGIDKKGMDLFYETIDNLKKNHDLAIILISHDLEYVAKYADEVILLDRKVLKRGTPKEVFTSREFFDTFGNTEYLTR